MKRKRSIVAFAASLVLAFTLSACSSSDGYDSGYAEGHKVGYDEGNSAGYDKGYADGYKVGYDEGGGIGYDNGYAAGQQAAYESAPSESGTEFVSAAPDAWSGDLGAYHVEIKGARLSKDRDGSPAIIVVFAWTNNSKETTSALTVFKEKAFQNGIEADFSAYIEGYNLSPELKEIRPGATLEVERAFKLTSETAPVEVEITELRGRDGAVVKATFNPAEL